jgi:hypothetical protein
LVAIVFEPDQDAIIAYVEGEVVANRRLDHRSVVERRPLGGIDRRLAMLGADDHQRLLQQPANSQCLDHLPDRGVYKN